MRLLISCYPKSGGVDTRKLAHEVMELARWLVNPERDDDFIDVKRAELVNRLPEHIRTEISGVHPDVVEVRPGVWGLCSTERAGTMSLRLFDENLGELEDAATHVVSRLRAAFAHAATEIDFEPRVEIRKNENEEQMRVGRIIPRRDEDFRAYLALHRARDRRLLRVLALLAAVAIALGGVLVAFRYAAGTYPWWLEGTTDRLATALLTGTLTTYLSLRFDYRDWRTAGDTVEWY